MKNEQYLQELEFELCRDFGVEERDFAEEEEKYEEEYEELERIPICLIKIVKIFDDGYLGRRMKRWSNWFWFDRDEINANVGDVIFIDFDFDKILYWRKMDIELLKKFFQELKKENFDYYDYYYIEEEIKNAIMNDKLSIDYLKERVEERRRKEEEERRKEEEEERRKDKIYQKYITESVYYGNDMKVNKNIIEFSSSGVTIKFKKNVNEILSFDEFRALGSLDIPYHSFGKIIARKEGFEYVFGTRTIKVEFNPTRINGIKVKYNRVKFLFEHLKKDENIDIKLYNAFSEMAIKLMKVKKINIENDKFDIEMTPIDKENWKITLFGKTKEISWKKLKELFYGGRGRRCRKSFDVFNAPLLYEEMGLTKQEFLDFVKKNRILQNLCENESD